MIVGVGIDVVPVERFAGALARTPTLADRLFTPEERVTDSGGPRSAESLAARFAAKEALAKALGAPGGMRWTDAEIVSDDAGRPHLIVTGPRSRNVCNTRSPVTQRFRSPAFAAASAANQKGKHRRGVRASSG